MVWHFSFFMKCAILQKSLLSYISVDLLTKLYDSYAILMATSTAILGNKSYLFNSQLVCILKACQQLLAPISNYWHIIRVD